MCVLFRMTGRRLAVLMLLSIGLLLSACAHLVPTVPDLSMIPAPGSENVDPRQPVIVEARGVASRLERVEILDPTGRALGGTLSGNRYESKGPLEFGTTYRVSVVTDNLVGTQQIRQEQWFTTVAAPRLEGGSVRAPDPDGNLALRFDRPVGRIRVIGAGRVDVEAGPDRRSFRLTLPKDAVGKAGSLKLEWETPNGVPLPPMALELGVQAQAVPKAKLDLDGRKNVGVALPCALTFTGPTPDRDGVARRFTVRTAGGEPIAGKWAWTGERRLRFVPDSYWPPLSTIEIVADEGTPSSMTSGTNGQNVIGSFSTGPDRRIAVYLDSQRVVALEDGKIVRSFRASTGKPKTPTVTGSFYIYARYPLKTMKSDAKPGEPGHYVVENVPFAQYFHRDYALHGAWWHNGFGRPASHGCVNLATRTRNKRWPNSPEDAGWLYEWATFGVPVTVYPRAPASS